MSNKNNLDLMIEEYKSLRDQINKTLVNRIIILGLGLATIGALVGFADRNLEEESTIVSALVFGIMIPTTAFATVFLWISEVRRGRRASGYIGGLERRFNKELRGGILRWEEDIKLPEANELLHLFRGHYYAIILFFTVVGGASAHFGSMAMKWNSGFSFLWVAGVTFTMLTILIPQCMRLSRYGKPDSKWPERFSD